MLRGEHLGLGKEGAGLLVGGEAIGSQVYDADDNERCSITYNISTETGFHVGFNFAGVEATFMHDENDECPFQQGGWLRFRSFSLIVEFLNVEFTHKGTRATADTDSDVGISAGAGIVFIEATAESGTTDDD